MDGEMDGDLKSVLNFNYLDWYLIINKQYYNFIYQY